MPSVSNVRWNSAYASRSVENKSSQTVDASFLVDDLKRPTFAAFGKPIDFHANRNPLARNGSAQWRILNFRIIPDHESKATAI